MEESMVQEPRVWATEQRALQLVASTTLDKWLLPLLAPEAALTLAV